MVIDFIGRARFQRVLSSLKVHAVAQTALRVACLFAISKRQENRRQGSRVGVDAISIREKT